MKRPRGRPSLGLSEVRIELRAPKDLAKSVAKKSKALKITTSEGWRRAAVVWVKEEGK